MIPCSVGPEGNDSMETIRGERQARYQTPATGENYHLHGMEMNTEQVLVGIA